MHTVYQHNHAPQLRSRRMLAALVVSLLPFISACSGASGGSASASNVDAFLVNAERTLDSLTVRSSRATWVQENFITDDTEILNAEALRDLSVAVQKLAVESKQFDGKTLTPDQKRKLLLLKLALTAPPPADPAKATELSQLSAGMDADYGKGTYCRPSKTPGKSQECLQQQELSNILAVSRNNEELVDAWRGWHSTSAPMRTKYARFVDLSNEGARGLGFADAGAMWRSGYDMTPEQFASNMDSTWNQLRPLYLSLHAYVRSKLNAKYGDKVAPSTGPIPAQLLGNMWSQEWGTIYDVVAPNGTPATVNVTALLKAKDVTEVQMVHYGENFFKSLGFDSLPATFWKRSLFLKPKDREVVCHASAWDIDNKNDLRVKMCIEPTAEFFQTVHHELGHNFYQRAYNKLPTLFQNGANDGFHEAIGDAIALSITPTYLQQVGLLKTLPPPSGDTLLLLQQALDKVAFLPFGLLVDQWRWKVFSGEVKPDGYNKAWWDLKLKYQGVVPPVVRSESDFDPGAKYHVASNTPYSRYFLAHILEFQFYRAMCRAAGHKGPLYTCS